MYNIYVYIYIYIYIYICVCVYCVHTQVVSSKAGASGFLRIYYCANTASNTVTSTQIQIAIQKESIVCNRLYMTTFYIFE